MCQAWQGERVPPLPWLCPASPQLSTSLSLTPLVPKVWAGEPSAVRILSSGAAVTVRAFVGRHTHFPPQPGLKRPFLLQT